MIVELIRLEEDFDYGTFGALKVNKQIYCATLEPADLLNATSVSSIPAQQYMCVRHKSPRFGETFMVSNVPGRSHVLFHPGNTKNDTEGCILLGQYWGKLSGPNGARAVLNSGNTFKEFMNKMSGVNEFHLTVSEVY